MQPAVRYLLVTTLSLFLVYWGAFTSKAHPDGLVFHAGGISQRRVIVDGRWKTVRKALGLSVLPPLQTSAILDPLLQSPTKTSSAGKMRYNLEIASRFGLRRKRELEELEAQSFDANTVTPPPELFFSPDALEEPTISFDEFMVTLRKSTANKRIEGTKSKLKGASSTRSGEARRRAAAKWIKRDD